MYQSSKKLGRLHIARSLEKNSKQSLVQTVQSDKKKYCMYKKKQWLKVKW